MKVTKNIREYIEEQVEIKAMQSITDLKEKAEEATQKFNDEYDSMLEECTALCKTVLSKHGFGNVDRLHRSIGFAHYDLPEVIAYNEARHALYDKKRLAVLEIVAEMELGGSKKELMEKLESLKF